MRARSQQLFLILILLCLSFGADQVEQLRCQWSAADRLSSGDFAYLEPRLALRSVLLNELPAGVGREGLVETLLQMCREARQSAHYQVSLQFHSPLFTILNEI